jgi:hypothetical protein
VQNDHIGAGAILLATKTAVGTPWINNLPIAVMSGAWLAPLVLFWLAVAGPLRPNEYPPAPAGPSLGAALLTTLLALAASRVSEPYFRLRAFERTGRLYEVVGVRLFRGLVPDGDLINRLQRRRTAGYRVVRGRQDAIAFLVRTQASERGHLVLFVAGGVTAGYAALLGWGGWALVIGLGNVPVNVYPILLQRYTRGRIVRALRRLLE